MVTLRCSDYGFSCEYEIAGKDSVVIDGFADHFANEHGIDYSRESLMLLVIRKSGKI